MTMNKINVDVLASVDQFKDKIDKQVYDKLMLILDRLYTQSNVIDRAVRHNKISNSLRKERQYKSIEQPVVYYHDDSTDDEGNINEDPESYVGICWEDIRCQYHMIGDENNLNFYMWIFDIECKHTGYYFDIDNYQELYEMINILKYHLHLRKN